MTQCLTCEKEATFDEYLCILCARALGIVNSQYNYSAYATFLQIGMVTVLAQQQHLKNNPHPNSPVQLDYMSMLRAPTTSYVHTRRLLYQSRLFNMVEDVEGDIVECGVGNGETFINWCALAQNILAQRNIWGFDSFEGFPEPTPEDAGFGDLEAWKPMGTDTLRLIHDSLRTYGLDPAFLQSQVTLVKGFFKDTLDKHTGDKIALLHVDCDLYESYQDVLNALAPKVSEGGIIAIDEYINTFEFFNFPGASKATDAWREQHPEFTLQRDRLFGKYYLKRE